MALKWLQYLVLSAFLILLFQPMEIDAQSTNPEFKTSLVALDSPFHLADSIELHFNVSNAGKKTARLCKYMTPLEGFNGNILKVTDAAGNAVPYIGIMKKRGKPKPSDYIRMVPDLGIEVRFHLKEAYRIERPGTYRIQFLGNPSLNQLPDSDVLEITVLE